MSVRSKDIAYESKEPSFLRKLRSQYGGDSDRHERPLARPRKEREDGEDDAPTYVDESSHDTITKEEYEKMVNPESREDEGQDLTADTKPETSSQKQSSPPTTHKAVEASIGTKKRRLPKTVDTTDDKVGEGAEPPKKTAKKSSKKSKVKLSFDDES